MSLCRLPLTSSGAANGDFLLKLAKSLADPEYNIPPLLKLLNLLRSDMVDGCSITTLDVGNEDEYSGVLEWIRSGLVNKTLSATEDLVLQLLSLSNTCAFLALPLITANMRSPATWLLAWRSKSLFTGPDAVTLQIACYLIFNRGRSDERQILSSNQSSIPRLNSALALPHDQDTYMFKQALNGLQDSLIMCRKDGSILSINDMAASLFAESLNELQDQFGIGWIGTGEAKTSA